MTINPIIPIWLMAIICIAIIALKRKGVLPFIRQIVIALLLFAINLRVMVPDPNHIVNEPKIDAYVLFAVDSTISMLAEDMVDNKTRLEEAKEDMKYVVDQLNGAKFAVVDFNNSARLVTPFTDDVNRVKSAINIIDPVSKTYAQGSSFNGCHDLIGEQLKLAHDKDDANVYIFFISDGENNQDEELDSFKDLKKYVDGGSVLGYGTSKGGKMKVTTYSGEEVVLDSHGQEAISVIDEENLMDFADQMDISYVHMKHQENIDPVIESVLENVEETQQEKTEFAFKETYYFLLPPLVVLLVWDFIHYKRKV